MHSDMKHGGLSGIIEKHGGSLRYESYMVSLSEEKQSIFHADSHETLKNVEKLSRMHCVHLNDSMVQCVHDPTNQP
jgi:hypothetical protein